MRHDIFARFTAFAVFISLLVAAPTVAQPPAGQAAPQFTPVTIKLLEAGAEPRRELRYKPQAGVVQTVLSRSATKMDMGAAGANAPAMPKMDMPVMEGRSKSEVVSVGADGTVQVNTTLEDMKAVGGQTAGLTAMDQMIAQMKGKTSTTTIDSRGFVRGGMPVAAGGMDFGSGGSDPYMQWPTEPVGVGAKWESVMQMTQQGMSIEMRVTSVVTGITGDIVDLNMTLTGSTQNSGGPGAQGAQNPAAAMDMKMDMSGAGICRVDLTKPMPVYQQMTASMKMKLNMQGEGGKGGMNLDQTIQSENSSWDEAYGSERTKDLEEADALIKQAAAKWNEKDFDGAIAAAEKALTLRLKHLPPGHADVVKVEGMIKAAKEAKK